MSTYFIGDSDQPLDNSLADHLPDDGTSAAQLDVINEYVGHVDHPLTVQDANYLALANGWWHPPTDSGMQEAGHLLDAYGVPNHHVEGGDFQQLLSELDNGHQVIVGINDHHGAQSGPMHELHQFLEDKLGFDPLPTPSSHHTVTVKGLDRSDPDHPQVVIHDPTRVDGATTNFPLAKFEEALNGQNLSFLATDAPPGQQHIDQPHHHHLISDVVGLGATALAMHLGDPTIALAAGKLADVATDKLWDSILAHI